MMLDAAFDTTTLIRIVSRRNGSVPFESTVPTDPDELYHGCCQPKPREASFAPLLPRLSGSIPRKHRGNTAAGQLAMRLTT